MKRATIKETDAIASRIGDKLGEKADVVYGASDCRFYLGCGRGERKNPYGQSITELHKWLRAFEAGVDAALSRKAEDIA